MKLEWPSRVWERGSNGWTSREANMFDFDRRERVERVMAILKLRRLRKKK